MNWSWLKRNIWIDYYSTFCKWTWFTKKENSISFFAFSSHFPTFALVYLAFSLAITRLCAHFCNQITLINFWQNHNEIVCICVYVLPAHQWVLLKWNFVYQWVAFFLSCYCCCCCCCSLEHKTRKHPEQLNVMWAFNHPSRHIHTHSESVDICIFVCFISILRPILMASQQMNIIICWI